jgi:hypothetical protein
MNTQTQEALKIENSDFNNCTKQELFEYILVLREALEQPTVAELNNEYLRDTNVIGLEQPAWQGLTDDEVNEIVQKVSDDMYPWKGNMLTGKIIRAIEQALKEKNDKG